MLIEEIAAKIIAHGSRYHQVEIKDWHKLGTAYVINSKTFHVNSTMTFHVSPERIKCFYSWIICRPRDNTMDWPTVAFGWKDNVLMAVYHHDREQRSALLVFDFNAMTIDRYSVTDVKRILLNLGEW